MMRAPALFVAGLLLLLALILGIQLYRQYRDDIAAGPATARALTATLEEHAGRSLAAVDIFLTDFPETMSGVAGTLPITTLSALRQRMNTRLADTPQHRPYNVHDGHGDYTVTS